MKRDLMVDAVGKLDNDLLEKHFKEKEELKTKKAKPRKTVWLKWSAAVAACLLLVICATFLPQYIPVEYITDTNSLDLIFEVDNDLYNTEKSFNHRNTISNNVEHSKEENPPSNKKFTFNDNENEFVYYDTLFYPIGQKKVYRYFEDGKDDNVILLNEDGSINSILYKYTRLDIYGINDMNYVLIELKNELNKWVDVSKYEYVDVSEYEDGLENYDCLFYNMKEGYITDYMRVSVSTEGYVFGLSINNLMSEDFVLNINKVLEEKMINSKLADIYSTKSTEYKSYNTVFPPQVVVYDSELYIQYFVSANYIDSNGKESTSWLNCILIPVSLMTG